MKMHWNGNRASRGRRFLGWGALACSLGVLLGPPATTRVDASDHADAPLTQMDRMADIGDFYAWHTDRGTIVAVVTFNPGMLPGEEPEYDREVLYTIHIDNTADQVEAYDYLDNDNDNEADIQIYARFGQAAPGDWGVQLMNVPGAAEDPIVGPVDTVLSSGSATAMAGYFDDPFFFDLDGFQATLLDLMDDTEPADIEFSSLIAGMAVDTIAGTNTMAIVVEFDTALALDGNGDNFVQLWATTGRP